MRPLHWAVLAASAVLTGRTASAQAGARSPVAQVSITAVRAPSLAIELTSAASLSLPDLQPGLNEFTSPIGVRSQWNLAEAGVVTLIGYFADPSRALAGSLASITSSEVEGRVAGGAFAPFSGAAIGGAGVAGGSLPLYSLATSQLAGTRQDDVSLRLNVTNPLLPAGVYTGTLNLRLVVQ